MNPITTPSTSNQCSSLTKSPIRLNFGRGSYTFQAKTDSILTQIQWWIWEKRLIEQRVQRLCYKHLLHKFLSCLIFTHTLPMNTSPRIRTKNFLTLHPPPSFLPTYTQYPLSWWASMTFLALVPLVQWKLRNPFAPINGLLILQGLMKIWECIAIQLKLGWESLA